MPGAAAACTLTANGPRFPMASILDQILATKRDEVASRSKRTPVEALKETIAAMGRPRNFFQAVTTPSVASWGKKPLNLIAEVKKASPSARRHPGRF